MFNLEMRALSPSEAGSFRFRGAPLRRGGVFPSAQAFAETIFRGAQGQSRAESVYCRPRKVFVAERLSGGDGVLPTADRLTAKGSRGAVGAAALLLHSALPLRGRRKREFL